MAAGAALWAAPAINPVSRAFAGVAGCDDGACGGTAWGFAQNVIVPHSMLPPAPGSSCPGECDPGVSINQPGPPTAAVPLSARSGVYCACHTFDALTGACRSEASIEGVVVRLHRSLFRDPVTGLPAPTDFVVEADLLSSFTQVQCPECTVDREAETENVRIREPMTGVFVSFSNARPNTVIVNSRVLYPGFRIVANEQRCSPEGRWFTAALHVRLPRAVTDDGFGRHIFLGYSAAGLTSCASCTPSGEEDGPAPALIPIP